jgi:hypothetical protein
MNEWDYLDGMRHGLAFGCLFGVAALIALPWVYEIGKRVFQTLSSSLMQRNETSAEIASALHSIAAGLEQLAERAKHRQHHPDQQQSTGTSAHH